MTPATTLAAVAGAVAAVGVTDLARAVAAGRPRRRRSGLRRAGLALLARAGRGLGARVPHDLPRRLEAAGLETPPGDVAAVKAGAALVALLATLPLAADAPGRVGPPLAALAAGGAFLAPDLWIRARGRARARRIEAELGDVLDLLSVAVAAGLSPGRALAEVGRRHPGTLATELHRAAHAIALGIPAAEALASLERRAPAPGLAALTAAIHRATRHGAPLGPTLTAQAAEARARVGRRHAEQAARAAPQVQLVVALLLVPSVLLLVAAALVPT
jgi:tight adherence protein C